jgi:adenylate cyclase
MLAEMTRLSAEELALRAGTTRERVERLTELQILTPTIDGKRYAPGDIHRVQLVEACERAGIPFENVGRAIGSGHLSLAFTSSLYERSSQSFSRRTFGELAEEHGIPLELVRRLHMAMGLPRPEATDTVKEVDADILGEVFPMLQRMMAVGLGEAALSRALRVYGENLRRIAQAESDLFHSHVEAPLIESGMPERDVRQVAAQVGAEFAPVVERVVLWLYRTFQDHYVTEDLVEHIENAMEEGGVATRRPAIVPAMCFLDLTGYTRLTEERGDQAAAELAASLAGFVTESARAYGGLAVKWLGDGVMFHFPDPAGAIVCALDMVERTPEIGLPPAHVGVNAGPVIFRDGDYFGRTVNVAARIAGRAGPSEVLASDEAVTAAGAPDGVRFEAVGAVELKGVTRPVQLHRALRS